MGTIAGRLGFLANNNTTMIFVKGGAAWAADRYSQNQTNSGTTGIVVPPGTTVSAAGLSYGTVSDNRWGSMVGLGIEQALGHGWSAKIEYDFLDFGSKNYTFTGTCINATLNGVAQNTCGNVGAISQTNGIRQSISLMKFGLNYQFSWLR